MYKNSLEDAPKYVNGALVEALNGAAVVTDATDVINNAKVIKKGSKYKFDYFKDHTLPEFTLFFEGVAFATIGNVTGLIGPEKSGKSTLSSMIAAAAANPEIDVCGFSSQGLQKIILIDTEQCNYYAGLQFKRAGYLSGLDAKIFAGKSDFYTLRSASIEERRAVLFEVLDDAPNYSLVIVDGITDVLDSINDEATAAELWHELTDIAEKKKITIIAVIHTNNGGVARGWVGAELQKKCEAIIKIKNDEKNNVFDFVFSLTRGKRPTGGTFVINDENGKPYRVNDLPKDAGRPEKYPFKFWVGVYGNDTKLPLVTDALKDRLEKEGIERSKAGDIIREAKKKGYLTQEDKRGAPYFLKP
jgi:archaellum biogenesis ATPase FlaH